MVFPRSKITPPRVQFMPPAHNITAYLARIHDKHLSCLKQMDHSNQKEYEGYDDGNGHEREVSSQIICTS